MNENKNVPFIALVTMASDKACAYLSDVTLRGQRYDGATFKLDLKNLPLAEAPSDKADNKTVKRPIQSGDVVAINTDADFNITDVSVLKSAPAPDTDTLDVSNAIDAIAALRLLRRRQYEERHALEEMGII